MLVVLSWLLKEEEEWERSAGSVYLHVYCVEPDSFLRCLTEMVSCRGYSLEIISNCGMNFVKAAQKLNELVDNLDIHKIQQRTVDKGIK